MRVIGSIYAVHVLTTMPPLFFHFEATMTKPHKYCIFAIYAPFAVMPAIMLLRFALGGPGGRRAPRSSSDGASRRKSS